MDANEDRTAERKQAGTRLGQERAAVADGRSACAADGRATRPGMYVLADQPVGVRPCSIAGALEILGER
ncbi:hypothetical protein ACWDA7_51550 [Streptomyces sp. NPDC001156]